jgi:uncharacterized protein (DUF1501 family)
VDKDRWTPWSRRRFLTASGVTAAAALAAGATACSVGDLVGSGSPETRDGDTSVLVLITLYGGNDGLNTVVPAADSAYHDARPGLSYREDEVLPLGEGLGLNPGMKGLKELWNDKKLAVVRGVSYPRPDYSHFRSMSIWQTASPTSPLPTGWLGRWLDAAKEPDPLLAVSIGATLPPLLAGETTAGAAVALGGQQLPDAWRQVCTELSRHQDGVHPLLARAATSLGDLTRVSATFGPERPGAQDPQEQLAAQLDVVAKAIAVGAPTRAYCVSLGGFDTHANEKNSQARLLGQLDRGISGFLKKVAGKRVVVAVYSEFGRRVRANANQGTDHGTAGPVLIAGDPVKGGFYSDQPSLTKLEDGDLVMTTDFRDVYATLLERVLDTEPDRILNGHTTTLGFV